MIWGQVLGITFGAIILIYVLTYAWGFFFARELKKQEGNLLSRQSNQLPQTILKIQETIYQHQPVSLDRKEPSCHVKHCSEIQVHYQFSYEANGEAQEPQSNRKPLEQKQE